MNEKIYYLCVGIINYRTPQLTIDCLRSLIPNIINLDLAKVVIVDNNSQDNSTELIENAIEEYNWQSWVEFIPSDINGGFAYGNNLAISKVLKSKQKVDYCLLLNPDTLVREGALTSLCEFVENNPQVGIASSRLEDFDGKAGQLVG